jgi:hypothetical protein
VRSQTNKAIEPRPNLGLIVNIGGKGAAPREDEPGIWGEHADSQGGIAIVQPGEPAPDQPSHKPRQHIGYANMLW